MLIHSLTIALRSLRKNRLYDSLNLIGLIIAFASIALIWAYVQHETSFDAFHHSADRIVRTTYSYDNQQGFAVDWARVPVDFVNELVHEFPEVEQLIRFQIFGQRYIGVGDQKFRPKHAYVTDSTVFEVFDFDLIYGDPHTALVAPHSIVLTESAAMAYFGSTDVVGQTVQVTNDFDPKGDLYQVTAVMRDLPSNTHMPVELLLSFSNPDHRSGWAYVYLLLSEQAELADLEAKLPSFVEAYTDPESPFRVSFHLQPLTDIHLQSQLAREIVPNGNALYPKLFRFIGIFILLIALFNYVNLSSAMALGRSKEAGIRQLLGASRQQLLSYSLVESVLYNLVAALIGLLAAYLALPLFEAAVGNMLVFRPGQIMIGIFALSLIGGLLAGIYPAVLRSRISPLESAKKQMSVIEKKEGRWQLSLRKIMLSLQFAAAILLIGSSFVAWSQLQFIQQTHLDQEEEQVLALYANQPTVKDEYQTFRDRIRTIPGIREVAACMEVPSREIRDSGPVLVQGKNSNPDEAPMMDVQIISPGFINLMGMELLGGDIGVDRESFRKPEPFSDTYTPEDYLFNRSRTYLINETAMHQLGFDHVEEAIGQQINWSIGGYTMAYGPVTGVVRDFHQETLKNKVDPLVMFFEPIWLNNFLIKLDGNRAQEIISDINTVWEEMFAEYPMEANFLDDLYHQLYHHERIQLRLLILFSGLSIIIAFLGLFAFIAWALHTRRKELAIRTVLGARSWDLVEMISKDFWLVMILGTTIAIPASWVIVSDWLENFAYKVSISPFWYLLTLALVIGLLFTTIGIQLVNTASTKPVDALKEE